jgi:hypothetical protein
MLKFKFNLCFGVDDKEQNVTKTHLIFLMIKHANPRNHKIMYLF